ncbi:pirin family protein [Angustibacter sp. Root456]|uniref:pirin family protein n=1 Tax=Angustibacter sp. Root456 TaxID=1736539 RepID=UPI0006FC727F|nr:pirin family protein [Angustibacter sp. Root456]KQX62084.1 pirin [Angustibacter sp. Root456]
MSNREAQRFETVCVSETSDGPVHELVEGRDVPISKTNLVNRTLPHRDRRMVGAWCFVDTYGPDAVITMPGMRVPAHPHIGLQTVSWLLEGTIEHRDSLGSHQMVQPGELNLMTAGHGIAHSEESPQERPPRLHGAQLWVALPEHARHVEPRFEHVVDLPRLRLGDVTVTVIVGELAGEASPARVHSPLVGADLDVAGPAQVPLQVDFEHAVVVTSGQVEVDGELLRPGRLLYLGTGRDRLHVTSASGGRCLLLGGEPFDEEILMWWNFVGRTHEEIVEARERWMGELAGGFAGEQVRFGAVPGFTGAPLAAPALPTSRLRPRGRR